MINFNQLIRNTGRLHRKRYRYHTSTERCSTYKRISKTSWKKKFENDLSIIQIIIRWLTLNQVNCFSDWLDYLYNSSAFYRLVNGFGERLWLLAAHGLNELMIELGQFCQYITCPAMLEFMLCSQQGQCVIETTSGRRRCYWVNHQSVIVEEFFIGFFFYVSLFLSSVEKDLVLAWREVSRVSLESLGCFRWETRHRISFNVRTSFV